MADTHINAFEMDVQEKLKLVQAAQAEYQASLDRLEAKKKELGIADTQPPAAQPAEPEQPAEPPKSKLGLGKK